MRFRSMFFAVGALAAAATPLAAQATARVVTPGEFGIRRLDASRAVIGVTTGSSASPRDTLGILVVSIARGGPAEKAGIEEGNRIASINGVNLRLSAADVGDREMEGIMNRRLTRELDKLKPGDDVELRVYSGSGQTRAVRVKTVDPEDLYLSTRPATAVRTRIDDRPTLGLSIGANGSKRDTLGVFVAAVVDGGPAAKAGIEEGFRIQSINGVDLRVAREDAGDASIASVKMRRLSRELQELKVGEAVEIRVYGNGQARTVRATPVRSGELPRGARTSVIIGDGALMPSIVFPPVAIDADEIGASTRRAIERALDITGRRIEDGGRVLEEFGRGLGRDGLIRWFDDDDHIQLRTQLRDDLKDEILRSIRVPVRRTIHM